MSTNSINSNGTTNAARSTVAPGSGHWLPKCRTLLWLALPLTLAVGCASNPNRSAVPGNSFTDNPAPAAPAVSQQEPANVAVGREIFRMFLADTSANCSLSASANQGVVTLGGASFTGVERQSIVDQTWALAGVTQVRDEKGVDLTPTPASKAVAVR